MIEQVIPTLAPQRRAPDIQNLPNTQTKGSPLNIDKEALFDSIAQESADEGSSAESSSLKTFFTASLWFGYAVAIIVAVVLVWSASKELLIALPR